MKRYLVSAISIVAIIAVGALSSCKTKTESCECFSDNDGNVSPVTKEFTLNENSKTSITIYTAFTPTNYAYCNIEYIAGSDGIAKENEIDCRPNYDTVYNEGSNGLNDIFPISYTPADFDLNGYRTVLRLTPVNDTTPIWESSHRFSYEANGNIFTGRDTVREVNGVYVKQPFASGPYDYRLYIYDLVPERDSLSFDEFIEALAETENITKLSPELRVDSVVGKVCIVRNEVDCKIKNVEGLDDGDPLLMQ